MEIRELQKEIHELAKSKGWYDGKPRTKLELMMLIVSEVAEACEAVRKGSMPMYYGATEEGLKPEGELVELADAVIRIMDYCEFYGFDLQKAIEEKHEFNKGRTYRHGGKLY